MLMIVGLYISDRKNIFYRLQIYLDTITRICTSDIYSRYFFYRFYQKLLTEAEQRCIVLLLVEANAFTTGFAKKSAECGRTPSKSSEQREPSRGTISIQAEKASRKRDKKDGTNGKSRFLDYVWDGGG